MTETSTNDETTANTSNETVDVEIHYTKFVDDREHDAFEITRDIRTYAKPEDITAETFDLAYKQVHEGTVSLDDVVHPEKRDVVLGHIFSRMQGGRVDSELGYDGSETRSMMVGDVIVIDGRAALVGPGYSFPDLGDIDYLRSDNKRDPLTVDEFDTADALAWIVSRHARSVRDLEMGQHADRLFALSDQLRDELPGDRSDVSVTFVGHELDLLYEATQYTVEAGADGEITEDDVAVATRIYERLGGGVQDSSGDNSRAVGVNE